MRLTLGQFIDFTQARVLTAPEDLDLPLVGITWDSREVVPGAAFMALVGEKVDGHDFLPQALDAGARALLVTAGPEPKVIQMAQERACAVCVVEDAQLAFDSLARGYRGLLTCPVVAVTGSSGKTTTKDIIATVLGWGMSVKATKANRNNELGIPSTVLTADPDTQALVVEMGMRGFHQLEAACSIVAPTIGVITNIGTAHMELLGSQDNIARAKSELLSALPDSTGLAILNGDDPLTPALRGYGALEERGVQVITYGFGEDCQVRARDISFDAFGIPSYILCLPGKDPVQVTLGLPGAHNVSNSLAAAALADHLGMEADAIAAALATTRPSAMREEMLVAPSGLHIIDDTYNANPESMKASLNLLVNCSTSGRRVAVLGDMGELGEDEAARHREVGEAAAACGIDQLVCVGSLSEGMAQTAREAGLGKVFHFGTPDQALAFLKEDLRPEDIVLIKASRFMGLESIRKGLME